MTNVQKLELTWIGKDKQQRLEPRILLEDPDMSYHANKRVSDKDIFDNRLIYGDNLLALKALEQEFSRKIKCTYIDPPFNTGEMFEHYDDGIEHSLWLTQMRERVVILHRLLADDGTLFVHIDDNELAYLTVLLDEVFTRKNRLYTVTFKQGSATGHKSINPGCVNTTNYILIYAKNKASWRPNKLFTSRDRDKRYGQFIRNIDEDYSQWKFTTLSSSFLSSVGMTAKQAKEELEDYEKRIDEFVLENSRSVVQLARPDYKNVSEEARGVIDASKANPRKIYRLIRPPHSDMYFIGGQRILFYADKVKIVDGVAVAGEPLTTLWDDILSNNLHKEGSVEFPKGKKPEALLKRVIDLSTNRGDWVLDSFAGSGTTGATAQKMGRHWIMVELGDHAHTHIIPRLKKVIDGDDPGGVTEATGWKGGGGFRYYRLAPSLLEKDKFGNPVISKQYNAAMLAEAMCKLMGFRYEPGDVYWQQGRSTESDFLYTTTQTLSRQQIEALSEEVGPKRTLLICCSAFRAKAADFSNLTLRKIPMAVLSRCEWGKDDYSLNVASLPKAPEPDAAMFSDAALADRPPTNPTEARKRRTAARVDAAPGLFDVVASEGREKE
jgi:adenine-specific DNA-methyltransferase